MSAIQSIYRKHVLLYCRLEANGYNKSYSYLRDAVWPNIKSRTLTKVDKAKKTGAEPQNFDDIDNLVLEVLGRESASVIGLDVADTVTIPKENFPTAALEDAFVDYSSNATQSSFTTLLLDASNTCTYNEPLSTCETPININRNSKKRKLATDSSLQSDLKTMKLKLEVRKLQLEIIKLEKELDIVHMDIA